MPPLTRIVPMFSAGFALLGVSGTLFGLFSASGTVVVASLVLLLATVAVSVVHDCIW